MTSTRGKRTATWSLALGLAVLAGTAVMLRDHLLDQLAIWRLGDEEGAVRKRAAERLGERRVARAVPALVQAMRTDRDVVWTKAPIAFTDEGASPGPLLPDPDLALVRIGLSAVPALRDLLDEDDDRMRERAADAIINIQLPLDTAVPALLEVLGRTQNRDTYCTVANMLGHFGQRAAGAVPGLLGDLEGRDDESWSCLIAAIRRIEPEKPELIAALVKGLDDASHRRSAAVHLGEVGLAAKAAVPALLATLDGDSPEVYMEALWALPRVGCDPAILLPRLLAFLRSGEDEKQRAAVEAACDLGRDVTGIVPLLVEALKWVHASRPITEAVVGALVEIGPEALAALVGTLEQGDPLLRLCAAEALVAFGPEARAAVPALIRALSDADVDLRLEAMRALESIGPAAESAAPVLFDRLEGEVGWDRRLAAANALLGLGSTDPRLVRFLSGGLADEVDEVRAEAALACARLGEASRPALPLLRKAVKDESLLVRTIAAWALERLEPGSGRALPAFTEALEDEALRGMAAQALVELPEMAKALLPQLVALLDAEDWSGEVRIPAARAIGRLGPEAGAAAPQLSRCMASMDQDRAFVANRRMLRAALAEALESVQGRGAR